jgi:hypothetical protein
VNWRLPEWWHDGWGEADEKAARYYRRLVAYYVGEARRQARRAREAEEDLAIHRALLVAEMRSNGWNMDMERVKTEYDLGTLGKVKR